MLLLFSFGFILGCISIASGAETQCTAALNSWAIVKNEQSFFTKPKNPVKPGESPTAYCNFTFVPPPRRDDYFLFIEITVASVKPGIVDFTYPDGTKPEFSQAKNGHVAVKNFFAINDGGVKFAMKHTHLHPFIGMVDPSKPIILVQLIKGQIFESGNVKWHYFDGSFRLRAYWIGTRFKRGEGDYSRPKYYRPIGHVLQDLKGYEFQKGGQKKKGSSSVNLSTIILVVIVAISAGVIGFLVFKLRRKNLSSNNQQSTNAEQTALRTAEQPVDNAAESKL